MVDLLAVSDRYRSDFVQGHLTSYHAALAAAAARAGHRFSIAALERWTSTDDPLVGLRLPESEWPAIAARLSAALEGSSPKIVLVYEGGLDALRSLVDVARSDLRHSFIINLFGWEWPLDIPRGSRPRIRESRSDIGNAGILDLPPNVILLADTARRRFLAQSFGLDVAGVWPLSTSFDTREASEGDASTNSDAHRRVLVALNAWQLRDDDRTVAHVEKVLRIASDLPRLRFELLGSLPGRRRLRRDPVGRLRALPGAADGALTTRRYLDRIRSADAVWLPKLGLYATQSSGKALDALVNERPILAPSGTFGDLEQQRWVPGAPSYRDDDELLEILEDLDRSVDHWKRALAAAGDRVRAHYSPDNALATLLAMVASR